MKQVSTVNGAVPEVSSWLMTSAKQRIQRLMGIQNLIASVQTCLCWNAVSNALYFQTPTGMTGLQRLKLEECLYLNNIC
ncbi:hypothetical protein Q7C36_019043 [Tachysurus vachellii]|uniref:Uncharacterized protein n=1 Tax=Tachysurus vachellii TaxID=175792 RepID=A0AA88LVL9_TACVA|nr:hypothetical protein Q7C36_019043 [Tachysurus vachellii]